MGLNAESNHVLVHVFVTNAHVMIKTLKTQAKPRHSVDAFLVRPGRLPLWQGLSERRLGYRAGHPW